MASFRSRSFSEYLQIVWRRKLLIIFVAAGMLISTFFVIDRLPNIYESRASVVISGQNSDRQYMNAHVAAATEQMTSRGFLEPILESHKPYGPQSGKSDSSIEQLRQNLKIDTSYRSDFPERLTIAYRHKDPAIAKAVASDLTAVFDRTNDAVKKKMEDEAGAVANQIAEVENRLREMGQLRAAVAARRNAAGRVSGQLNAIRAQRIAAASSIETLTDKQFALQQQIAEQKRQIAEQQKIVKAAPSDARASSSYGVLLVRKAELEAQLKDYSTQYTDKNPKVLQTRTQLAEITSQIAQLNAGADQSGAPANSAEARELRAMNRELTKMETELAVTERELARKSNGAPVPVAGASLPVPVAASTGGGGEMPLEIGADADAVRKRYDFLLNRQEQLARAEMATGGLAPGIFQVVDPPTQPQMPVGPNKTKYRLFALALALGLALLVAFAVEIPRLYSITDYRDVEYYLGVPVIALIPETTGAEGGHQKRLLLGRAVSVLAVVALISIVFLLLNYLQVFTLIASLLG